MSESPATTTADIATRDGVAFRRRKKRRFTFRLRRRQDDHDESCDDPGKRRRSKGKGRGLARGKGRGPVGRMRLEAVYHGGKSMLRAWFGKGLLKRKAGGKRNGGKVSEYVGHKRRRYVLTKQGGGRYTIKRKK